MSTRTTRSFVLLAALVVSAARVDAQDPRAGNKLDEPTKRALRAILDSAKVQGIPQQPLLDKMNQGAAMGADGPRIVVAVRTLANDMAIAHKALGSLASSDEIKAAASAVHAGVPAVELGKIKKQGGLRRLALPFTVITDLVSRGVPVMPALNAVKSMLGAGAKDTELTDFQRNVKDDIQQGAPPAAAAETRAKASTEKKPDDRIEG